MRKFSEIRRAMKEASSLGELHRMVKESYLRPASLVSSPVQETEEVKADADKSTEVTF